MATAKVESGFTDDWQGERTLAECNLHMLKSADTCDVTFRVGQSEDIVRAHRYILISRSCVFYSMLCCDWSKEATITIPDVSKEFFEEFLSFLYTDDCSLTADNVTGLLYLSKKYAVHRLHRLCLSFLQSNITPENACVVLEQAHFFDEDQLFQQALKVITASGSVSLKSVGFRDLSRVCLDKILISSDLDLHIKPETIFDGIMSWASAECSRQGKEVTPRNQRDVLGETVYLVGFTGFDAAAFVQTVLPSKLLEEMEGLKILSNINCPDTDVGRFRIVDRTVRPTLKIEMLDVEVYAGYSKPKDPENSLFRHVNVHDTLFIRCDQKSKLHGITLVPSEASYSITVMQENTIILEIGCNTDLLNAKIDFPTSIELEPGLLYGVAVNHTGGKCPLMLMKGMKGTVRCQNKQFYFSRIPGFDHTRGLMVKLTMS